MTSAALKARRIGWWAFRQWFLRQPGATLSALTTILVEVLKSQGAVYV